MSSLSHPSAHPKKARGASSAAHDAATGALIAAAYERVSTRMQGMTGFSLGAQAKDTAQFATEQGWTIPDHLRFRDGEDRHASGADWDLPGLNAMLDAAKRHEFTVLVVPAVDRFARDMVKAKVLEQQLAKLGVRTVYVSSPVEDSPEGALLVNIQHVFAEYERSKIALRTMRGRREKIERGQVAGNGPAPYGYRYVREGVRNRVTGLAVDSQTAPIVERIFRESLQRPVKDVVEMLQAEMVTPPVGYSRREPARRWSHDVVLRILSHPVYAGRMVYGLGDGRRRASALLEATEQIGVAVPPIVDRGLWDDVQLALQRRQKARRAQGPSAADAYLLRGLLACGECGGLMSAKRNSIGPTAAERATSDRPKAVLYRTYHCLRSERGRAAAAGKPVCSMRDVYAEHLEAAAWGMVAEALMDPSRLRAGLDAARTEHQQAAAGRGGQLARVGREIDRLIVRTERTVDELLETPKGTEAYRTLVERQRDTENAIRRLRAEKAALEVEPEVGLTELAAAEIEGFAAEVRAGLNVATAAERRWVLDRLRLSGSIRMDPNGVRLGRLNHRYSLELNAAIRLHALHPSRWSLHLPAVLHAAAGTLRLVIETDGSRG